MSATYWIAKYVEDQFRNEPRNVGVIVILGGVTAARFWGERDDGVFDGRKVAKAFAYPAVYSQWRTFWRSQIRDIGALIDSATVNYYIQPGGEVTDTGAVTASEVCEFLYRLLVGNGPVEAFKWNDLVSPDLDLGSDITVALDQSAVLAKGDQLFARHPVLQNQTIRGKHVAHTPSFSQRNGKLYVFEYIDLVHRSANKAKERAGWMAYMFADIRDFEDTAESYSIVRLEDENAGEQIDYAKAVLSGESKIVNWSDPIQRGYFLQERRRVAEPQLPQVGLPPLLSG